MICKVCGTEIADKALICYRCGTSTFEPVKREGQRLRRKASVWPSLIALLVLAGSALFMGRAATGEVPRGVGIVLAVLAVIVIVWRFAQRRR